MLILPAGAALLVAAVVVAAWLPARGTIAYLVAAMLVAYTMVVASMGIAGLAVHSLSPLVLTAIAAVLLVAAVLPAVIQQRARAGWTARARHSTRTAFNVLRDVPVAVAATLVLGILAWRGFIALRLPIVDYDGWSYHMVFVDVWLQNDALSAVPQRIWTEGYPANSELFTAWLAAFTHSDALAGFTSLLPIPLAIAATAGIARSLAVGAPRALLAGLLMGLTPALVAQAGTTYVDTTSVAFVAATWWLGLRVVRGERDVAAAALLGIAAGLAVGTKGTNVLLVGPVVAAAAVAVARPALRAGPALRPSHQPVRMQSVLVGLAAIGIPILVLGASWYLKNLVVYGNPLYPFAVGPFQGPTTFTEFAFVPPQLEGKSLPVQLAQSWLADWNLTRYAYNVRPGGLGRAWPLLLLAAAIGVTLLVRRRSFAPLILVVLPAAVTLATMPMPWYARLTLFLPAIAAPLALVALDAVPRRAATPAALAIVAVAAVSAGFANIHPNIDISAALGPSQHAGFTNYIRYILDPAAERRANVSLRSDCRGFGEIPDGVTVGAAGFNLLHGVVGPSLSRRLSDPIAGSSDAAGLASTARSMGATWIVTSAGGDNETLARGAPDLFIDRGAICQGAHLWQLRSPS
jgi:hypothetical protein